MGEVNSCAKAYAERVKAAREYLDSLANPCTAAVDPSKAVVKPDIGDMVEASVPCGFCGKVLSEFAFSDRVCHDCLKARAKKYAKRLLASIEMDEQLSPVDMVTASIPETEDDIVLWSQVSDPKSYDIDAFVFDVPESYFTTAHYICRDHWVNPITGRCKECGHDK